MTLTTDSRNRDQINNAALTAAAKVFRANTIEPRHTYYDALRHAVVVYEQTKENIDAAQIIFAETVEAAGDIYDEAVAVHRRVFYAAVDKARDAYYRSDP